MYVSGLTDQKQFSVFDILIERTREERRKPRRVAMSCGIELCEYILVFHPIRCLTAKTLV